MELRHLRYFVAVAEAGSLTIAASATASVESGEAIAVGRAPSPRCGARVPRAGRDVALTAPL